ncbi:MAG TPA: CPBP family intramembrane metalloprotease [Planctomycetes bacterium]|nr:CPBP family intramembrane metalloprotease [Planctomycetaceae bacterium]HIM28325.1 CPBP family intramembrane metalloprotease [Planctomycetota bacterium]
MNSNTEPEQGGARQITVSRRGFIVGSVFGGSALTLLMLTRTQLLSRMVDKLEKRSLLERLRSEALSNRRNGIRTAVEALVVWATNIGVGEIADRLKVSHGGHAADGPLYDEQLEEAPYATYARDNFLIPIIEEAIFRLLPSAFFSEEKSPNVKLHWKTGLASTAIFSAIHNFSKPEHNKIRIHLDSLPLEQMVLGAYCWYAQRRGGFIHAAGAHVLYNNLCEAYYQFYERHLEQQESTS